MAALLGAAALTVGEPARFGWAAAGAASVAARWRSSDGSDPGPRPWRVETFKLSNDPDFEAKPVTGEFTASPILPA